MPSGHGKGRKYNSFDQECLKITGIIKVNNNNLCLPIAIVFGKAFIDKDSDYKKLCKVKSLQTKTAEELLATCNIEIPEEGSGICELQKFQNYLKDYKITVYQYGFKGRNVIFEGKTEGLPINLLYNENHYNVITSLTSAFCCKRYCESCHKPYEHKNEHRCKKTCPACQEAPVCDTN